MNNRSLIGRFKQVLSWVGKKSGKLFLEFDEKGTTRTCCKCNAVVEGGLSPKTRVWQCSECQTMHIRDENAPVNGPEGPCNKRRDNRFAHSVWLGPLACEGKMDLVCLAKWSSNYTAGARRRSYGSNRKLNRKHDSFRSV